MPATTGDGKEPVSARPWARSTARQICLIIDMSECAAIDSEDEIIDSIEHAMTCSIAEHTEQLTKERDELREKVEVVQRHYAGLEALNFDITHERDRLREKVRELEREKS